MIVGIVGSACVAQEAPRETLIGVLPARTSGALVQKLWHGNPNGREACNIIHTGYAGTLDNTLELLAACAEVTGGRMRVIVRPNTDDTGHYVQTLLKSLHADLIYGWYICDEPFGFPWDVDDAPRPGETRAEFWFRYRDAHAGTPPWPANVPAERADPGDLSPEELRDLEYRGGDDLYFLFRQRDDIRAAEAELGHEPLPMLGDYGGLAPTYGMVDGEIVAPSPPGRRLGYWWYDRARKAATWRVNGSVSWQGRPVQRKFGAFGEDIVICNWFSSPFDSDGTPRARAPNRIDFALATIRDDAPTPPVFFFLGYGQSPRNTRINMDLAETEGPVAGYLIWSWGLSDDMEPDWRGDDPDRHWAAMIESRP